MARKSSYLGRAGGGMKWKKKEPESDDWNVYYYNDRVAEKLAGWTCGWLEECVLVGSRQDWMNIAPIVFPLLLFSAGCIVSSLSQVRKVGGAKRERRRKRCRSAPYKEEEEEIPQNRFRSTSKADTFLLLLLLFCCSKWTTPSAMTPWRDEQQDRQQQQQIPKLLQIHSFGWEIGNSYTKLC